MNTGALHRGADPSISTSTLSRSALHAQPEKGHYLEELPLGEWITGLFLVAVRSLLSGRHGSLPKEDAPAHASLNHPWSLNRRFTCTTAGPASPRNIHVSTYLFVHHLKP